MRIYADTSFLVKLLSGEAGAPAAAAAYRRLNRPALFYLPLHVLEVENAIRQRAFHAKRILPSSERRQINRERDAALARMAKYLERGALTEMVLDMDSAMDRARQLSAAHTDRLGVRAIDLLHVACALVLESEVFLTFDQRQRELAKAEGLEVADLQALD
jgi:predicted nucleic acid-binding protein